MLTLTSVVAELLDRHPDACLVASCGYPSRELFGAADRPTNFYLVGSMGMAGPIALGLATARPDRLLVALDGDGSLLMNLGVLPMIAASGARLLHLVIDNGMHESTGGQQTVQRTDFTALALAAGYRSAARIERPGQLTALDAEHTPLLVQAITGARAGIGPGVGPSPAQLVARLRDELSRPPGPTR